MALQTDIGRRIPEGAVRLTREEALYHQRTVIKKWPSEYEVTFLRRGNLIAGFCNMFTSSIMFTYFTNYLKVGLRTSAMLFGPGILLPGFVGTLMADSTVTENILLMNMECPICQQMKFAFSQFYLGIAFPACYSYFTCAGVAMATNCYPIPHVQKEAREFWKATFRIFKEGTRRFHVAGLIQSVVVLFLPYLQSKEFLIVMNKLQEQEKATEYST